MTPSLELKIQRPPFWTRQVLFLGALPALLFSLLGPGWDELWHSLGLRFGLLAAAPAASLLFRVATRPRRVPSVQAFPEELIVPRSSDSSRTRTIPYQSIVGIELMARGKLPVLLIATQSGPVLLPLNRFVDRNAAQLLQSEVYTRLRELPRGFEVLGRIADQSRIARRVGAVRTHFTGGLLALLAGVFLFEEWTGATENAALLLRYGANAPALVREGQYFRLLSANFLHGGIVHLGMNAMGLLALGSLLERLLSWPRLALIYCLSGFTGALASMWFGHASLSVGASTAVFGLLGSLGYLSLRYRGQLPMGVQQPARTWLFIGGINTFLPVLIPQIDWIAHVGGGLGGALVTALIVARPEIVNRSLPASRLTRGLAIASCALCLGALGHALLRGSDHDASDAALIEQSLLTRSDSPLERVNNLAWGRAIDPAPNSAQLHQARQALELALARDQVDPSGDNELLLGAKDTLATLHYRLGDYAKAVDLERQVLGTGRDPLTTWQIARFAQAHLRAHGSRRRGEQSAETQVALLPSEPSALHPFEPKRVEIALRGARPNGAELWLLLFSGNTLLGTLVVSTAPSDTPTVVRRTLPRLPAQRGPLQIALAIVDTRACDKPCPTRANSVRFARPVPAIAQLP